MANDTTPVRVTFSGEYATFAEVDAAHPAVSNYHSGSSLEGLVAQAERKLAALAKGELPDSAWGNGRENIVLSVLSTIARDSPLRILDVGGGLGSFFVNLKASCPQLRVDYTILDLPETAQQGQALFSEFADVNFIADFPEKGQFDVLLFGSALQYFENYRETIERTLAYNPEIVILTDHPMGIVKTFVCAQVNMPDRVIPMMVFNVVQIVRIFEDLGYRLQMRTISHFPFHNFSNYENDISKSRYYNLILKRTGG